MKNSRQTLVFLLLTVFGSQNLLASEDGFKLSRCVRAQDQGQTFASELLAVSLDSTSCERIKENVQVFELELGDLSLSFRDQNYQSCWFMGALAGTLETGDRLGAQCQGADVQSKPCDLSFRKKACKEGLTFADFENFRIENLSTPDTKHCVSEGLLVLKDLAKGGGCDGLE